MPAIIAQRSRVRKLLRIPWGLWEGWSAKMREAAVPYNVPMITALLRSMPAARLARVDASTFQRWPLAVTTRAPIIRELIANERARRK